MIYAALLSFLRLLSVLSLHHSPCNSVGLSQRFCHCITSPLPMLVSLMACVPDSFTLLQSLINSGPLPSIGAIPLSHCPHSTLCVTDPAFLSNSVLKPASASPTQHVLMLICYINPAPVSPDHSPISIFLLCPAPASYIMPQY